MRDSGFVYFVHAPAIEAVKIGFTALEPLRRVKGTEPMRSTLTPYRLRVESVACAVHASAQTNH